MTNWNKPIEVNDAEMVFPAEVMGRLMPYYKDLPEGFNGQGKWMNNPWCKNAETWMFNGVDVKKSTVKFKDTLDETEQRMVWRQLQCCMGSFEPKHEHKMAGVGYLMSLFFDKLEVVGR
tara:strand:- start:618 stop:974 length:357 start_codon:yes stop_codon:yes gene_type:complete